MAEKPGVEAALERLQAALARVETAAARLRARSGNDAAADNRHRKLQAEVEAAIAGLDRLIDTAQAR